MTPLGQNNKARKIFSYYYFQVKLIFEVETLVYYKRSFLNSLAGEILIHVKIGRKTMQGCIISSLKRGVLHEDSRSTK
jgi:hypothetical protein